MWQLFEISARLKLVSVPFSSLLLDIGHLQKRFPGEHHESSEMGQSYYVSQSLHRPISYYIFVSFGYTDQSSWSGLRQKGTILFPFLWWPPSLWPREQAELCSAVWTLRIIPVSRLESETSLIINEVCHFLQTWHSNYKILNTWHCLSYFTANMDRFLTNSGLPSCKLSNNVASYELFYGVLRRSESTIAFCTNDIMCHAIWCYLSSLPY